MGHILLVSTDETAAAEASRALTALGHVVRQVETLDAASAAHQAQPADIFVVDTDEACTEGRDAVRKLRSRSGQGPRIVWTGMGVASGLGLVFAEVPDSVLPLPVTMAGAGTALARIDRPGGLRASRQLDLGAIDGSCEHFPPFRVLWALARSRSTGRLELYLDEVERELFLKDGRVVAARGFPKALAEHGIEGEEDDDLETLIGRAIAAGVRPDLAMEAAARGLALAVAEAVGRSGGMVFFDPAADLPERSLPLPGSIPRLLVDSLTAVRPVARVRRMLGPHRSDKLAAAEPGFGPQDLPPVALRLWRSAQEGRVLGEELASDEDDAWLAADLLLQLGLACLEARDVPEAKASEAPQETPAERPRADQRLHERRKPRPDPRPDPDRERTRTRARTGRKRRRSRQSEADPTPEPTALERLHSERARLGELDALGVLGITQSSELNQRSIDERFRLMSSRFHPDRYVRDGSEAQDLARQCFSLVNEAYQALRDADAVTLLRKKMHAKEQGDVYVSDDDRRKARLLFAKGEVAFRRRKWSESEEALALAHALNPKDWRTTFLLTRARYERGTLPAADAAMELMGLEAPPGRQSSDLLYHLGEFLLEANRDEAAFKAFRESVEHWDQNVAAKRRLRLRTMRRQGVHAVRSQDEVERERRAQLRAEDPHWSKPKSRSSSRRSEPSPSKEDGDSSSSRVSRTLGELFKRK